MELIGKIIAIHPGWDRIVQLEVETEHGNFFCDCSDITLPHIGCWAKIVTSSNEYASLCNWWE